MTIIDRRTFMAEHGKLEEALAALQEAGKEVGQRYRLYQSHYGTFDTLAFEVEFESIAAMEDFWNAMNAGPQMEDFMARWYTLVRPGGLNEVWVLAASHE